MSQTLDIITAFNGPKETTKISYDSHEPISTLLNRIKTAQYSNDIPLARHDLFINGIRLYDHTKTLDYYRILGRTLTYRAVEASMQGRDEIISIDVLAPTGRVVPLTCYRNTCVGMVKEMVWNMTGILPGDQTLFHTNRQLADFRDLKFYGLVTGSSLILASPLPSTTPHPGIVFVDDMPDYFGLRTIRFSHDAPRGRVASTGINVECRCDCTPTHRVIVQKGLGILDLSTTTLTCPNCHQSGRITPIAIGYRKCKYRLHLLAAYKGKQLTTAWLKIVPENHYDLVPNHYSNVSIFRRWVIEAVGLEECENCTVCLHPLALPVVLECGHQFHPGCRQLWKGVCPNCEFNKHLIFATDTAPPLN